MGIDWEAILGTSGAGLAEAYENTVADVIYFDAPIEEFEGQDPALVDDSKHHDRRLNCRFRPHGGT